MPSSAEVISLALLWQSKVIKLPGLKHCQVVGLVGHVVLTPHLTPLTHKNLDALTLGINVQVGLSGRGKGCIVIGLKNDLIQRLIILTADLALRPSSFYLLCTVLMYNH